MSVLACRTGDRFNTTMTFYQYRKSHCGAKTILRPSYLHNGIPYTDKTASLYLIGALVANATDIMVSYLSIISLQLQQYWNLVHYGIADQNAF